jgi:transketolase
MSGEGADSYSGYLEAMAEISGNFPGSVVMECGEISRGRVFKIGSSEQHMVLCAAGMALTGRAVFLSSPLNPAFIARAYEQIRAAVAIPSLRVILSAVHDGDELGLGGAVRQMNEDFALTRALPGMTVLAPSDRRSAYVLSRSLETWEGPAYMRLSYSRTGEIYGSGDSDFHPGGARLLTEGDGVTICAAGIMVREALKAGEILLAQGIGAEIIDCYSIKPFPEQTLLASVRRTGCCVVAEKHAGSGGLYGAVTECLGSGYPVPVRGVSEMDRFGQSGTPDELREYYGLTHREIVHNVLQVWAMRRR